MSGMGHLWTIPMAGCPLRPRAPTFAHLQKTMGAPSGHDPDYETVRDGANSVLWWRSQAFGP